MINLIWWSRPHIYGTLKRSHLISRSIRKNIYGRLRCHEGDDGENIKKARNCVRVKNSLRASSPIWASKLMGCMLPTMHCRSQHCWELLHPFAHHCQRGRNNSQHCWRNNVGSCWVRLHAALRFDSELVCYFWIHANILFAVSVPQVHVNTLLTLRYTWYI